MSNDDIITGRFPAPADGAVLHMVDFDHGNPTRILSELRSYWQSLQKGRAIPQRSDIEPRGIGRALDYAFILERVAPGAARFRLAGRHLIDLMGMEVRGMPICSFLNPSSRGRLSDVLETVFQAPQLAELRLQAGGEYARPALTGRMLLMPLRSDLGDVTRALGCLIAEGEIGSAPRRFDLAADRVFPVFEGAEILPPSPSSSAASRGFGEGAGGWQSGADKRDQRPAQPDHSPDRAEPSPEPKTPEDRRALFRLISRDD